MYKVKTKLVACLKSSFIYGIFIFSLFPFAAEAVLVINQDTTLASDINDLVVIQGSNLFLDCQGHKITGKDSGIIGELNAIEVKSSENIRIKNCIIEKSFRGILVGSSSNVVIEGSTFRTVNGIHAFFSQEVSILNNSFEAPPGSLNFQGRAAVLEFSNGTKIENNTIKNFFLGIFIDGIRNIVNSNSILGIFDGSIGLQINGGHSYGNVISENIITGHFNALVLSETSNNTVLNNLLASNRSGGLVMEGKAHNNSISNNTIHNNFRGMRLIGISTRIPTENIVFHNNIFMNSFFNVTGENITSSIELSHNGEGNFWGRTSLPCFRKFGSPPPVDSNTAFIIDSHPFCKESGWDTPPDTIAPDTNITNVRSGNGENITNNGTSFSSSISFQFISNEAAKFECKIDEGPFEMCTSEKSYSSLSIGSHQFSVRSRDEAGNVDSTAAIFEWRVSFRPVILLPGLLGSWTNNFFEPFVNPGLLPQHRLEFTEESSSSFWKQLDALGFLPHTWGLVKTGLPGAGVSVFRCPYDWRLRNSDIARDYLIPCIDKAKLESGSARANIIAHSMGGIVARAYIQDDALYRNDVDKFVMLGTPNYGSPNAYYPWEGADLFKGWFGVIGTIFEKAVGNRLTQIGVHVFRTASVQYVHSFFPSLQELLPTFTYLKDQSGFFRGAASFVWQNPLLPDLNSRASLARLTSSVNTKVFAGEGYSTLETVRVLYPNPDNLFGNPIEPYPDGLPLPLFEETSTLGDKTVLSQKSAKIIEASVPFEAKTRTASDPASYLEHTNLPNAFFQEILSFLGGSAISTSKFSPTLPDEVLAISLASPADLLITDSQGRRLGFGVNSGNEKYEIPRGIYSGRDELELAAIINPIPGEYHVSISGIGEGEFAAGITYAKEECEEIANQDNFGRAHPGSITVFTLDLRGGCKDAAEFFLPATIDIDPDTLNLRSRGNFVTAYIELPSGYDVGAINVLSIRLNNVPAVPFPANVGDHDKDDRPDLMVKFGRTELEKLLTGGIQEVFLRGKLLDGTLIGGSDKIMILE